MGERFTERQRGLPVDAHEELVTAWVAGMLPARHDDELAAAVREPGPFREAYRALITDLSSERVVVRRGGPRAPELARRIKALVLPHLGRNAPLLVQEEEGGGTAWHWPGAPVRRVAEGEPFAEFGDDVTGPLRVPIEYAEPSAVEDARLLERASDECVSLARTDPQSAHARALGLVGILRSFEDELRRVARSEPDDEASDGDVDLAESLVSARLSLEEVLVELPDNGALSQALLELDESLADAAEATLLADPRAYEEHLARVVPLPGRWWSLRAEIDEVLPDHLLERLREAPV